MSTAVMIPVDHLVLDTAYQPRARGLSPSHLKLLRESDPQTWEALLVAPNGDGAYTVLDGFHRTTVACELGLKQLPCIVQDGAGYPEAVAANISHGLPLSSDDRKEAARWWAEQEPHLSYREIGRRVGLSDKTVKRALSYPTSEPSPSPSPASPTERWLRATYRLDAPPSLREVRADIETFAAEYRADVATFYAAIGQALVTAASSYLTGG